MFLSDKFYKFIQAKPKKGTNDARVVFKCVQCRKGIHCSTASYSNLRRHIDRMHTCIIKEYDDLWARHRRKRSHKDDEESERLKGGKTVQENTGKSCISKGVSGMDPLCEISPSYSDYEKKLPNDIYIPQLENLIKDKDQDVSFKHNKYTHSKLGKFKKYMYYVVDKRYQQEKGKQGSYGGRPSPFVYCRVCQKVIEEEGVKEHDCVKAISSIINIYESDKSRITIVREETVNAFYPFIHPVKQDNQLTDLAYCDRCNSFLPKAIVMKSEYNHRCLGSEGRAKRAIFKSRNLESIYQRRAAGRLRWFKCKLCSKIFKTAETAEIHMRNEHGEGEKQVLCSHCGEGFETLLRAQRHEISQHGGKDGNEEVPSTKLEYQCPECQKKFNKKQKLKLHMFRIHSNAARNCICDQCGKAVRSMNELREHIKTHGEKTVKCDLCELKFRDTSNMKKHRMTHTGERPNVCPYCQHGFIQITDCKSHIRKVHGIVVPKGMTMKTYCDSLSTNPE